MPICQEIPGLAAGFPDIDQPDPPKPGAFPEQLCSTADRHSTASVEPGPVTFLADGARGDPRSSLVSLPLKHPLRVAV
jgi:hypothetical protein